MIGILAYGSLITDPGWEIEQVTAWRIPDVVTPFAVEYARSSHSRNGAPTLVLLDGDNWDPGNAIILVLRKGTRKQTALNYLYRRETHRVGDSTKRHNAEMPRDTNRVSIQSLQNFHDLSTVFYTYIRPNIPEILDQSISSQQKADRLAQLAIDSLTDETYWTCQDGIHYLAATLALARAPAAQKNGETAAASAADVALNTTQIVNVREGPGTGFAVLGQIMPGERRRGPGRPLVPGLRLHLPPGLGQVQPAAQGASWLHAPHHAVPVRRTGRCVRP